MTSPLPKSAATKYALHYVDKNNLKAVVLASCHYDILEWLRPDWYFDTATGTLHNGRLLCRPSIKLRMQTNFLENVCKPSLSEQQA